MHLAFIYLIDRIWENMSYLIAIISISIFIKCKKLDLKISFAAWAREFKACQYYSICWWL